MKSKHTPKDHLWQRLRSAYYEFDLLRKLPLGDYVGRTIHAWEIEHGFGDSPKGKEAWDDQYKRGDWDYMGRLQESSRYSAIVGYITMLQREGALLDVGCGEGILYERIKHLGCLYTGLDISEIAICRLQARYKDASAKFLTADADLYDPNLLFDLIVFNESLYYLQQPLKALQRYAAALKPHGILIVSTYMDSRRARAILRDVKEAFLVLDETKTTQGSMSWLCTVLKPRSGL
jgi:2-polyprenyl-3-methyl-5-hydroxy-6-metoxy-1,4-benzoquinol methylase